MARSMLLRPSSRSTRERPENRDSQDPAYGLSGAELDRAEQSLYYYDGRHESYLDVRIFRKQDLIYFKFSIITLLTKVLV